MLHKAINLLSRIFPLLLATGAVLSAQIRFNNRTDLSYGTANAPYSDQLVAAGGSLEGQPTQVGTSSFSATVTDGLGHTATQDIQVTVNDEGTLTITTNPTWR
jgi:hypothetical protein